MESKKLVLELFSHSFNFDELGVKSSICIDAIREEFADDNTAKEMEFIVDLVGDCIPFTCRITFDELGDMCYSLSSDKKHLSASCVNGNKLTKFLIAQMYVLVFEEEIIANRFTKEYFANVFLNEHKDHHAYDLIMNDEIVEFCHEYIEKMTLAM